MNSIDLKKKKLHDAILTLLDKYACDEHKCLLEQDWDRFVEELVVGILAKSRYQVAREVWREWREQAPFYADAGTFAHWLIQQEEEDENRQA